MLDFDSMTRSERAVAVAKDVIATVTAPDKRVKVDQGYYLAAQSHFPLDAWDKDLRDCLPTLETNGCTVCSRGAAVLSKARLFDNIPMKKFLYTPDEGDEEIYFNRPEWADTEDILADVFSKDTRNLMECAFECTSWHRNGTDFHLAFGAALFGNNYGTLDRLVAIMDNIIENDGEFVVEPATHQQYATALGNDWDYIYLNPGTSAL